MLALVSCDKLFTGDRTGKPVTFSASSEVPAGTKTAYSGEVIDGWERINWVDKDPVRMIMFTHGQYDRNPVETDTKTYYVVDIHEEGEKSVGKVAAAGAFLTWRENLTHDFYSIYPGNYIGSTNIGYNREITLTLPSAQHGDIATNMRYAYMAAIHEGYTTAGKGSVVLDYYPMVTTVYITLNNATQAPMTIRSVRIKSVSGQALVGTYTITSSGGTTPFSPQGWGETATSPEVSVVLDDATLQPGESTTCVIFLMPTKTYSTSDLKLTVVTNGGVSDLPMQNSAVSQFDPCKKYNLSFNVEERPVEISDLTPVMNTLCVLSNSALCADFEYIDWLTPKGLYYKGDEWPRRPVPDDVLAEALLQVTEISNENIEGMTDKLINLTPADFTIFPNLKSINLTGLGSNNSFSVANLSNLIGLIYGGNASHLSITNCNFNQEETSPLVIKSTRWLSNITLTNITGLKEIVLQAGDETQPEWNRGGNIGEVFIQNCPDLQTIRIISVGGQVAMDKAVFDNLGVKTIYIEQANTTKEIEVRDCYNLERFIVANQSNDKFESISLTNCPVLGDSAVDNSEFGLTGFNVEWVAMNFIARKDNCPNLGPTFNTKNDRGAITVTFQE